MKLGICCNPDRPFGAGDRLRLWELNVAMTLSGDSDDLNDCTSSSRISITVDAFNCFIPGNLKLTGPQRILRP